jgi:hypothetical protein
MLVGFILVYKNLGEIDIKKIKEIYNIMRGMDDLQS